VVAALGAAFLSTGGAFLLEMYRTYRRAKIARSDELKMACIQIISGAQRLLFKAAALHVSMEVRSGLRESLDLAMHHRKPIDILELNDYMMVEQGKILDAQAAIWLTGDELLITSAGEILDAVGKLIVASTALPPGREVDPSADALTKLWVAINNLKPLKHSPESEAKIRDCARTLGRSCVAFGRAMRTRLKTADVDAILRAFPGFSEPPSEDSGTSVAEEASASA
jgi:hypothetical protein